MKMKVRCVGYKKSERNFTIGNIYTWEDDVLTSDNYTYGTMAIGTNIDNWELSDSYIFKKVEDSENKDMTDEDIWNMLKPKMDKNGIKSLSLSPKLVMKAVSLAYRCGYGRGSKGRPFKYNNVKSKPNTYVINKNGDKIYYCNDEVKIGDKVVFIGTSICRSNAWPEHGTVGEVVEYCDIFNEDGLWVKWEDNGETRHNWRMYCKKVVD